MNFFISTARVSVLLFVLFSAFTIFHSPNANALIQVGGGCTWDENTGTLTCPGGGGGGGDCDVTICGGGGPGGGGTGGGGGGSLPGVDTYARKIKTDKKFCIRSNEQCSNWSLRSQTTCLLEGYPKSEPCSIATQNEERASCSSVSSQNPC